VSFTCRNCSLTLSNHRKQLKIILIVYPNFFMKKASFWQTVKRFMEPALHNKRKLILFSIMYVFWKIYEFANVFAFSEIVSSLDKRNTLQFTHILIYFLIFIAIYQIVNYYHYKFFDFMNPKCIDILMKNIFRN